MSLLVVSAFKPEAKPTLELLTKNKVPFEYFQLGVGPIHAAKSEALLKKAARGRTVLYVGSCGSFYSFKDLHLVSVDSVYWMPPCLRTGIAKIPLILHKPIYFPNSEISLPKKAVLTSPSVSLVNAFAENVEKNLPSKELLVENMELYACAEALLEAKSLYVILGVTNEVGPSGSKDWEKNFKEIAHMTASFVEGSLIFT